MNDLPAWAVKRPPGRPRGDSKYCRALDVIGHPATLEDILAGMTPKDYPPSRKAMYMALYQLAQSGTIEKRGEYWGLPGAFEGASDEA